MTKTMWLVNWEDLSIICATKEAAVHYVDKEAKKLELLIRWTNDEPGWMEFACTWKDGITQLCEITEYPIQ